MSQEVDETPEELHWGLQLRGSSGRDRPRGEVVNGDGAHWRSTEISVKIDLKSRFYPPSAALGQAPNLRLAGWLQQGRYRQASLNVVLQWDNSAVTKTEENVVL